MTRRIITITTVLFCAGNSLFCQTIQFKGQLLQNNVPVKNYTVLIDGKPATTDDAGVFHTPLGKAATQITIQASDQQYVIVYPAGGHTLVPKDASLVTTIVAAAFKQNNYITQYLALNKQVQSSANKSQAQVKQQQIQLDSMITLLHKLSYTDSDLRSAKEIQEGKDRNLPDITTDLNAYIRNAQNLLSAFKYVSDFAFGNSRALDELTIAVSTYNDSYNRLDNKRDFYQQALSDYWNSSVADSFKTVVTFALDTVHTQNIYPLRDLLQQVRDYFLANKKNDALKQAIQKKISDVINVDNDLIDELKAATARFTQSLIT